MRQSRSRSHTEWCKLIEGQQAGEETIAAYCRRRGLVEHSFYHHKRRMRQESVGGGFCEVALSGRTGIRVVVDGQACWVELERGFDAGCLLEVVQALR